MILKQHTLQHTYFSEEFKQQRSLCLGKWIRAKSSFTAVFSLSQNAHNFVGDSRVHTYKALKIVFNMQAFLDKTVDFFTLSERGHARNALGYKIKIVVTRAESCENQQEKERRGYFKGQSQCSSVSNSHLQWYLDSSESFNGDNTDPPFRLLGQLRTLFRAMINFLCLGMGRSQKGWNRKYGEEREVVSLLASSLDVSSSAFHPASPAPPHGPPQQDTARRSPFSQVFPPVFGQRRERWLENGEQESMSRPLSLPGASGLQVMSPQCRSVGKSPSAVTSHREALAVVTVPAKEVHLLGSRITTPSQ